MDEKTYNRLVNKMKMLNQERGRLKMMLKLVETESVRIYTLIGKHDDDESLRKRLRESVNLEE